MITVGPETSVLSVSPVFQYLLLISLAFVRDHLSPPSCLTGSAICLSVCGFVFGDHALSKVVKQVFQPEDGCGLPVHFMFLESIDDWDYRP